MTLVLIAGLAVTCYHFHRAQVQNRALLSVLAGGTPGLSLPSILPVNLLSIGNGSASTIDYTSAIAAMMRSRYFSERLTPC